MRRVWSRRLRQFWRSRWKECKRKTKGAASSSNNSLFFFSCFQPLENNTVCFNRGPGRRPAFLSGRSKQEKSKSKSGYPSCAALPITPTLFKRTAGSTLLPAAFINRPFFFLLLLFSFSQRRERKKKVCKASVSIAHVDS